LTDTRASGWPLPDAWQCGNSGLRSSAAVSGSGWRHILNIPYHTDTRPSSDWASASRRRPRDTRSMHEVETQSLKGHPQ
jgi:hypothetical protein